MESEHPAPASDDLVERGRKASAVVDSYDSKNCLVRDLVDRITSDAATIASLRAEVEGASRQYWQMSKYRDREIQRCRREAELKAAAEAERDALKAEVARKDAALHEISNAYTAHGYSDAMDAVQALKDLAKGALK